MNKATISRIISRVNRLLKKLHLPYKSAEYDAGGDMVIVDALSIVETDIPYPRIGKPNYKVKGFEVAVAVQGDVTTLLETQREDEAVDAVILELVADLLRRDVENYIDPQDLPNSSYR